MTAVPGTVPRIASGVISFGSMDEDGGRTASGGQSRPGDPP